MEKNVEEKVIENNLVEKLKNESKISSKKNNKLLGVIMITGILAVIACLIILVFLNKDDTTVNLENDNDQLETSNKNKSDLDENLQDDDIENEEEQDNVSEEIDNNDDDLNVEDEDDVPVSKVKTINDYKTPEEMVELVQYPTYGDVDKEVYVNGGISYDQMSDHYKFSLANNLIDTTSEYIYEEDMKKAFENFFGKNTYRMVQNVVIGCMPYTYDATNKRYVPNSFGCGGASTFSVHQKVLGTITENGIYKIKTMVLYSNENGFYKDANTSKLISKDDNFDIDSYIKNNSSTLEEYTYTFEMKDGHYIYKGVSRTRSYK